MKILPLYILFLSLFFVGIALAAEFVEEPNCFVTLAWDTPTTNADGSPMKDLAGFKIYGATKSGGPYVVVAETNEKTNQITVSCKEHTYFVATASNSLGVESDFSNEVHAPKPNAPTQLRIIKIEINISISQ